ncbi:MAG: RNA 2',3'-cyclic phosphodiesterase [Chloroflexi bacterium]|nr:RNA 2',3'-cyclic phosphodiesterase [Chloroflexota bacterium]
MFPRRNDQNPGQPGPNRPPGGPPGRPPFGPPGRSPGRPPSGPPGRSPGGPPRPPFNPQREIQRRDFHAPTVGGPGVRPGWNPPVTPESRDDLWRLFIATDLSDEAKQVLTGTAWKVPEFLRPNVRWSRAEMMHLTLRFIGDTAQDRVEAITECMTDAAKRSGKFTLRLDDTGAFPDLRQPKVLWVGINGEIDRLQMLHSRLEGALARIDILGEDRHYNPHLTVGRLQSQVPPIAAGQVGQAFSHIKLPEPRPTLPVESLVLYRSRLMVDGPKYEELSRAPLG